ncbi:MAG: hypothetical protein DCC57_24410 [Chloroflexi bacterium]|nr:MAG: hypothetical protein DCC57_24410 [Chloroflexota bacterium]
MPISTSSFGDERDNKYNEYERADLYDQETIHVPGLDAATAESLLKKLGGGVVDKHRQLEGMGWKAIITPTAEGVTIEFDAHDELLEDLLRRFEEMADKVAR